jgi:hypothetical protein
VRVPAEPSKELCLGARVRGVRMIMMHVHVCLLVYVYESGGYEWRGIYMGERALLL